jgi:hypothetical protein
MQVCYTCSGNEQSLVKLDQKKFLTEIQYDKKNTALFSLLSSQNFLLCDRIARQAGQ